MKEQEFIDILSEELIPAMGCTEPIAFAYAAAVGRRTLGREPERILAKCSGNMIKNVRCVAIPNSGGLTGIEAACILGAVAGDPDGKMEVLSKADDEGRARTRALLSKKACSVEFLESEIPLHFILILSSGTDEVTVEVRHAHTNIVSILKNGATVFEETEEIVETGHKTDRSCLSVEEILKFAENVDAGKLRPLFAPQITCNMAIAEEGMSGKYGLGIGKVILTSGNDTLTARMKAYAAAASEARMGGCELPVIINSGSGNQGIASSVPVIVYAREKKLPEEKLYRALALSALITVFQKEYIGKLSAFCGAVSASTAASAAITYLAGGTEAQIRSAIDNTLANTSGILCDGAKVSCAAKIAAGLEAGIIAHELAMRDRKYEAFTGILQGNTEETVRAVGHIGRVGMRGTDREIIRLMVE